MATPHDDLFHFTFQHVRHAAGWMQSVLLAPLADAIDWSTLTPAPEKLQRATLRHQITDLVFSAELAATKATLWLLAEHKSFRDADVESQLLRYVVHLADRAPRPGMRTPIPVVPIVLYHGDKPFAGANPGRRGPSSSEGAVALAALQPHLPFLVDDLSQQGEAELRRPGLTALAQVVLLCLRFLRGLDAPEALQALDRWAELLRAVDRDAGPPVGSDAITTLGWYVLRVTEIPARDLHAASERILQRPEATIMSTAEKLKREGILEGEARGRAETVLLLLGKRFGPTPAATVERIRSATTAELECWATRILDATTLAEVFGDPS
ncbi:MAG TPA: Rpn family recombination-promoting nuclease/putative transposase [Planctomycetota bacterium]|nr:Rpn family recombination-promoting nuclease/putative transposase [Planctomycetota bacterium]